MSSPGWDPSCSRNQASPGHSRAAVRGEPHTSSTLPRGRLDPRGLRSAFYSLDIVLVSLQKQGPIRSQSGSVVRAADGVCESPDSFSRTNIGSAIHTDGQRMRFRPAHVSRLRERGLAPERSAGACTHFRLAREYRHAPRESIKPSPPLSVRATLGLARHRPSRVEGGHSAFPRCRRPLDDEHVPTGSSSNAGERQRKSRKSPFAWPCRRLW